MKIVVFDIHGKFAHFRKFYTNSSSLTYGVPPRTTIAGMIAAILGLERDSYYDKFSSERLKIGVRKLSGTKKLLQTLNYLKATSSSELINPKDHTQVPFEILMGENNLGYRIYLSYEEVDLLNEIEERLKDNRVFFPPYLGSASFSCRLSYIDTFEGESCVDEDYTSISTVLRADYVEEIDILSYSGRLIKERMPIDFFEGRRIKEVASYIYDDKGCPIDVKLKNEYIKLSDGEIITFM